jgi:hypothetical protein
LVFVSNFGCTSGCVANLDADPAVSGSDFLAFLSLYGTVCQ